MIVSHKHKFIFIKTNKTAGTSVEIALSNSAVDEDIITRISPDRRIHSKIAGLSRARKSSRPDRRIQSAIIASACCGTKETALLQPHVRARGEAVSRRRDLEQLFQILLRTPSVRPGHFAVLLAAQTRTAAVDFGFPRFRRAEPAAQRGYDLYTIDAHSPSTGSAATKTSRRARTAAAIDSHSTPRSNCRVQKARFGRPAQPARDPERRRQAAYPRDVSHRIRALRLRLLKRRRLPRPRLGANRYPRQPVRELEQRFRPAAMRPLERVPVALIGVPPPGSTGSGGSGLLLRDATSLFMQSPEEAQLYWPDLDCPAWPHQPKIA